MADAERKLSNGKSRIDFQTDPTKYRHWKLKVDGEDGSALGVMSQGELNCLALSLFLPRASMPESFIIRSLFLRNDLRLFQLAAKPTRNLAP